MAGIAMVMSACGNQGKDYDATGTFEATEITLSAEQSGQLLAFDVSEGDSIGCGQEVGLVDTTQLWLKMQQLMKTREVYQNQKPDLDKQIAATRQQLAKAQAEQRRYQELVADGAAPGKMLDDAANQVLVLQRQLEAQTSALNSQLSTLNSQQSALDVQVSQLRDQLRKCHVVSPIGGTILEKYVERGEFVTIGKPLLKVADVSHMVLRAYVTSARLQKIKVGQRAKVLADFGNGQKREYEGRVSWMSSRSEFTPKTILTDDERADLVYAVKVAFRNDGYAKIGMYGEVAFVGEE